MNQSVFPDCAYARGRGRGKREKNGLTKLSTGFRGISYLTSRSRCDQSDYRYAVIAHYGMFGIQLKAAMMPLHIVAEYRAVKMET